MNTAKAELAALQVDAPRSEAARAALKAIYIVARYPKDTQKLQQAKYDFSAYAPLWLNFSINDLANVVKEKERN